MIKKEGVAMNGIAEILTVKNIVIYLMVINLIGFLSMYIDKQKARKGAWRIPEKTLFMITVLGGGVGSITGMYLFHHKTKKLMFTIGMPTILICEIILMIYLMIENKV